MSPNATLLMRAIQSLWRTNIKRFFSQAEMHYPSRKGQGKHIGSDITSVFHCYILKGNIVGQIDTSDAVYINYLIRGAPPSKGAYVPSLGGRIDTGTWKGIPTIYWLTWQSFFKNAVLALIAEYGFKSEQKRRPDKKRNYDDLKAARVREVTRVRNIVAAGRLLL